jgi:lysyl-tRNA synthetase class I
MIFIVGPWITGTSATGETPRSRHALGAVMSESRVPPAIEPVLCPKCGKAMMLTRIEPAEPGRDLRTFECQCGHSETLEVAYK